MHIKPCLYYYGQGFCYFTIVINVLSTFHAPYLHTNTSKIPIIIIFSQPHT